MSEIQVFRLTPKEGQAYYYAECTRKVYNNKDWRDTKCYTSNNLAYVGVFVSHHSVGYRDNAHHWDIFDKNGTKVIVHYSYGGNTCYLDFDESNSHYLNPSDTNTCYGEVNTCYGDIESVSITTDVQVPVPTPITKCDGLDWRDGRGDDEWSKVKASSE